MKITLTPEQIEYAAAVGRYRREKAQRRHYFDRNTVVERGARRIQYSMEFFDIVAVGGEIAFWLYSGLPWTQHLHYVKGQPDFLPDIEVRTAMRHDYCLMVGRNDYLNRRYVLITIDKAPWEFWIRGWLFGLEAQQRHVKMLGSAYLTPARLLNPM